MFRLFQWAELQDEVQLELQGEVQLELQGELQLEPQGGMQDELQGKHNYMLNCRVPQSRQHA
jgi:hypothetical protein